MKCSLEVPPEARLPTEFGEFRLQGFRGDNLALIRGQLDLERPVLLRVHSACITSEVFGSLRCDCAQQLRASMQMLAEAGSGLILYLRQEGRGIGLLNKLRAYHLQDGGADTVEANRCLGFAEDQRDYADALEMLDYFGVSQVELLTNNPRKVEALRAAGFQVVARRPLEMRANPDSQSYLRTKKEKLGHWLEEVR